MHFLHNLFIAFDDLVDADSQLWKVETIGDAFMVASGLNADLNRSGISDASTVEYTLSGGGAPMEVRSAKDLEPSSGVSSNTSTGRSFAFPW